jgi:hypothetical protein
MCFRAILLASLLVANSSLTIACQGNIQDVTSPTEDSASGSADGGLAPPPQPSAPTSRTCDATKAQFAIGSRASDVLLERSRVAAQAAVARFLRPNQTITMEFLASRLNLNLNERGIVSSTHCG